MFRRPVRTMIGGTTFFWVGGEKRGGCWRVFRRPVRTKFFRISSVVLSAFLAYRETTRPDTSVNEITRLDTCVRVRHSVLRTYAPRDLVDILHVLMQSLKRCQVMTEGQSLPQTLLVMLLVSAFLVNSKRF